MWQIGYLMSPLETLRRGGTITDSEFDALYPSWIQELSEMFWTPVGVAQRVTQFLVDKPGDRVLDVGSGVGKFCFVGAGSSGGVFHGIEQREELVKVASELAAKHPWTPELTEFRHGNMLDISWRGYQGIYLFNPFFEQTSGPWCQIDDRVRYSRKTQKHYIQGALDKLAETEPGTRIATYFGFGASLPCSYRKIAYERFDKGPLEVWVKG